VQVESLKHGDRAERALAPHAGSHNQRRIIQDRARTGTASNAA